MRQSAGGNPTLFDHRFGQILTKSIENIVQVGRIPNHQIRLLSHLQASQPVGPQMAAAAFSVTAVRTSSGLMP